MKVPSRLFTSVPLVGPVTTVALDGTRVPSESESGPDPLFARTLKKTAVSSGVVTRSGWATGGTFTLMVTLAELLDGSRSAGESADTDAALLIPLPEVPALTVAVMFRSTDDPGVRSPIVHTPVPAT